MPQHNSAINGEVSSYYGIIAGISKKSAIRAIKIALAVKIPKFNILVILALNSTKNPRLEKRGKYFADK